MERIQVTPGVLDLNFQHERVNTGGKTEVRNELEAIFARHRRIRTKGRFSSTGVKVRFFFVCCFIGK